ncbi:hypothetical protein QO021_29105 (plasmid) [Pseudomonas amygdali pv. lachrymans]|uniref:Uncharacterized protein n=1 Tax=Pseudomonas syringae pv. maculicola str. ES4326 TaxID=629265 RepID=A0A8T8CAK9_PSEYM|nr:MULTISPECIES: hypothetical protein [Pseudomonas syringae group]QHF00651.1 hypothetical protein PMA4326_029575 [Pseudomonas syringae pv. maculicola str. ES4326]RMM39098.1 hypothetical protein ALQ79_200076 [Pseudomonas amygdali pv. lachrymans]UBZ00645.1 hypothetical protein LCG56_28200 [Pseudomonas cannabina pv. alisalensis]WIO61619.1 hypothetical protein QO021_29105 [Pseudomonas amygdali pv. lachrymans]
MSPLEQAKEWLSNEKPCTEEIQQSVDNLCHQVARPPTGVTVEQLTDAISHLMKSIGKDPAELVLPEPPPKACLDLSPLGASSELIVAEIDSAERRRRFEQLKEDLRSPF